MSDCNRRLQQRIEPHLIRISEILGPDYKLTLIARCTRADLDDADILLTIDDWERARTAADRLAKREPSVKPDASPADLGSAGK